MHFHQPYLLTTPTNAMCCSTALCVLDLKTGRGCWIIKSISVYILDALHYSLHRARDYMYVCHTVTTRYVL